MKKLITILTIVTSLQVSAGVGALTAIFNPGVGGTIALAGLGISAVAQVPLNSDDEDTHIGGAIFTLMGLIILNEETGEISFTKLDYETGIENDLTVTEIDTYNASLDEIDIIFNEVASQLDSKSTVEESKELWENYKEFLPVDAFKVMTVLAK